jgi:hypothetical protein
MWAPSRWPVICSSSSGSSLTGTCMLRGQSELSSYPPAGSIYFNGMLTWTVCLGCSTRRCTGTIRQIIEVAVQGAREGSAETWAAEKKIHRLDAVKAGQERPCLGLAALISARLRSRKLGPPWLEECASAFRLL